MAEVPSVAKIWLLEGGVVGVSRVRPTKGRWIMDCSSSKEAHSLIGAACVLGYDGVNRFAPVDPAYKSTGKRTATHTRKHFKMWVEFRKDKQRKLL
jgi:hypothetical protein